MQLCFASFIKILKYCSKPDTLNKTLCGATLKVIDENYGETIYTDDTTVSNLMNCVRNLSPQFIVRPAQSMEAYTIANGVNKFVMQLLDTDRIPLAILALRELAVESAKKPETLIGVYTRQQLESMTDFVPNEFLASILLYTTAFVENKIGKNTIKQVTKEFVDGFETKRESINIRSKVVIQTHELETTLKSSDFNAVFCKIENDEDLKVDNTSSVNLYCLDISDSAFDYMALNDYLFDSVGMYVYSRTQMKDFEDKGKVRSMGAKALRLMKSNGEPGEKGTGNELGEMLLFTFLEDDLHAPKLLSKVEINSTGSQFKSKSDSVHLLKIQENNKVSYQLVFGASSINGNISDAVDTAFEVLKGIKEGRNRERQMVDSTLFNHTFDLETTEKLRQVLVPSKERQQAPDMAFGIFIGYTLDINKLSNSEFRTAALNKMKSDIHQIIPYINKKIEESNLGMHSYYFYFLPLNDAENDKHRIMENLLIGDNS